MDIGCPFNFKSASISEKFTQGILFSLIGYLTSYDVYFTVLWFTVVGQIALSMICSGNRGSLGEREDAKEIRALVVLEKESGQHY